MGEREGGAGAGGGGGGGARGGREGWKVTMSHLHCFRHRRLHQTEVRQGREEELKQAKPRELH